MEDFDALDILRIVSVPKEPHFFALPTRDRPGRIVSQQRRALTISNAIITSLRNIQRPCRLAVIGAGFGGIAAAVYAATEGADVSLFESSTKLLDRFADSPRIVDPRIADWPHKGWISNTSGLRGFDWKAQTADSLRLLTLDILAKAERIFPLRVYLESNVVSLPFVDLFRPRQLWWKSKQNQFGQISSFDAVLICTGFGSERQPTGWSAAERDSYWHPPNNRPDAEHVTIIGNGDGGLFELFALLGFVAEKHREWLLELSDQYKMGRLFARFTEFENAHSFLNDTATSDFSKEVTERYFGELRDLFNIYPHKFTSSEMASALRSQPRQITVIGQTRYILSLHAFAVNRLTAAILLMPLDGDPLAGSYILRGPCDGKTTRINYIDATARIDTMDWDDQKGAHNVNLIVEQKIAGGFSLADHSDIVIPRGGPELVTNEWANRMIETFKGKNSLSQLNLLERAVPHYLLHSNPYGVSNENVNRPTSFGSEYYDSFIQGIVFRQFKRYNMDIVNTYLGKLRLDMLMHSTLRLSDANIFDGIFFHKIMLSEPLKLEFMSYLKEGKVEIVSRESSFDAALTKFIHQNEFPELTILNICPIEQIDYLPSDELWCRTKEIIGVSSDNSWFEIFGLLSDSWKPASWLQQCFTEMSKFFGRVEFRRWRRAAVRRPAFDALGINISEITTRDTSYTDQIKELMAEALRPNSSRSRVLRAQRPPPKLCSVHLNQPAGKEFRRLRIVV